jgi:ABC-type sulfate/molybdate transport systems ATPase subunit
VLLLDEPRNSLDEDGRGLLREQVERALAAGATVLWCSPSGEEQALPCHVAYDLRDGRLERVR